MKKQLRLLLAFIFAGVFSCFISCTDNDNMADINNYSTTFNVYECNVGFSMQKAASSRFVSENAIITIWESVYNTEIETYDYFPVTQLKTGIDGSATYTHNNQYIYYSVEKVDTDTKSNLAIIKIRNADQIKTITFQIEGVFTSDEDINTHAKFNIDPTTLIDYAPHIGSLKFKDINRDGLIDEKDAIYMAEINAFDTHDQIIYIAGQK